MDKSKINLSLIKYKFKSFQFVIGKKKYPVDDRLIMEFNITEDFDNSYFPYFEITLAVPNSTYRIMSKNQNEIKAVISLYKGKFKETVSVEPDEKSSFKKCINGTFKVFMDDATPDLTEQQQKIVEKMDEYGQFTTMKILLYPYNFFNKYDLVVNACLQNVTLADAIIYLLNKGCITNILMSPPSNYKKKSQFILPPISISKQLSRICNTYALHKKGSIVYFGLNRGYIIDKDTKCTAYSKNEYKTTYIIYETNSYGTNSSGGCCAYKKDKYNVLNAMGLTFNNSNDFLQKKVGNNIVSVDNEGNITKTNKKSSKITNVIIQTEGDNTSKAFKNSINENKNVLSMTFGDIDISMLTPNKLFVVSISGAKYKKYNGKYRLSKSIHQFTKEGNYFQLSTVIELKK